MAISLLNHEQEAILAQQPDPQPSLVLSDSSALPDNPDQVFSRNLVSNEEFDLGVFVYPSNQLLVAADIDISFDPQVVEVLEKNETGFFPTYVEPVNQGYLDPVTGHVSLSGVAFDLQEEHPTEPISTSGQFASFHLKVKDGLAPQVSLIHFQPQEIETNSATDSNLVSLQGADNNPEDILGKVSHFQLIIEQPGDINGDSAVDILDFWFIARFFGEAEFEIRADLNRDGQVDILDFYQVANHYGGSY